MPLYLIKKYLREGLLIYRGLSTSILQISSYIQDVQEIMINLLPDFDLWSFLKKKTK